MRIHERLAHAALTGESGSLRDKLERDCPYLSSDPLMRKAEAIGWAMAIRWRLTHFTPNVGPSTWLFMFPVTSVSGPQRTIDGHVVMADPPTTAWSGCNVMPPFETREGAIEWAQMVGLRFTE